MLAYSKHEVVLVRHPFSDLSSSKVRPAVIVGAPHSSHDVFIVPLTSRTTALVAGEFVLADWAGAGLNVPSAIKRGVYTVHATLIVRAVGRLSPEDGQRVEQSLRDWLGL